MANGINGGDENGLKFNDNEMGPINEEDEEMALCGGAME
jgi:hypothetical protein